MPAPGAEWLRSTTAVLERTREGIEGLAAFDLDQVCCQGELSDCVLALQGLRSTLEAAEARLLARWDTSKEWRLDGAKSAAAWLAWKQRIPISVARQRLRHARCPTPMPGPTHRRRLTERAPDPRNDPDATQRALALRADVGRDGIVVREPV